MNKSLGWMHIFFLFLIGIVVAVDSNKKRRASALSGISIVGNNNSHGKNADPNAKEVERVRFVVEGTTTALFFCGDCQEQLQQEQDNILEAIKSGYGGSEEVVQLVSAQQKLVNALFVVLPIIKASSSAATTGQEEKLPTSMDATMAWLETVPGVSRVSESVDYTTSQLVYPTLFDIAAYLGQDDAENTFCATGAGVRVAVLDTGIDYTHRIFGGAGTVEAYNQAYGTSRYDGTNKRRDGLFPTSQVVEGIDYLGDGVITATFDFSPDDDPIDSPSGHGTRVGSAIVAVAPNVELLAIKVCSNEGACPDSSMVEGLSYAIEQGASIANLSLGRKYTSAYYSITAKAIEDAFALGLLTVLAAGNEDDIPYVMGGISASPNGICVGSTFAEGLSGTGVMASYSSRGPGGYGSINNNNLLKPDISAPGGKIILADAGSGEFGLVSAGTSFAAPFVSGAAALMFERCPSCSPFAVKALLMNNARRTILYQNDNPTTIAPLSWMGSGELDITKSLNAPVWAYSLQDVQPSISLGLFDVVADEAITRTLVLTSLSDAAETFLITFQFRDPSDEISGALTINIPQATVTMDASCNSEVQFDVQFLINAANVPSNHMTSSGIAGADPSNLNANEFDGWIVVTSLTKGVDIAIPFHTILRKAANLVVGNSILPPLRRTPLQFEANILNDGSGIAQIDAFELLHLSEDDAEDDRGSGIPSADLKYVGMRTLKVGEDDCEYLVEFAFVLWESKKTVVNTQHQVRIDVDGDFNADFILANRAQHYFDTPVSECRVETVATGIWNCTNFPPDHSTNTAVTIVRSCSNNIVTPNQPFNVGFSTVAYPQIGLFADTSNAFTVTVPATTISAPSYDIQPGETLRTIEISGNGRTPDGSDAMGLLLIANAFRSRTSTGAATLASEATVLTFDGVRIPEEVTPDFLFHPAAIDLDGPSCTWSEVASTCPIRRRLSTIPISTSDIGTLSLGRRVQETDSEMCPESPVPRALVLSTLVTDSPSLSPTVSPTIRPTSRPSRFPTLRPTSFPETRAPTKSPTSMPQEDPTPETRAPTKSPTSMPQEDPTSFTPPLASEPSGPTAEDTLTTAQMLTTAMPTVSPGVPSAARSRCNCAMSTAVISLVVGLATFLF